MPLTTEPRPAALPLTGGRRGCTVRVHPILTGEIHAPPSHTDRPSGRLGRLRAAAQLVGSHAEWNWLPVPAFLIEHPTAGPILVDTGLHPSCATDVGANMGTPGKLLFKIRMNREQALRFALPRRGFHTDDIGLVIITHLHIDHASAVSEFPHATFLVDKREWAAADAGGWREGYHHRQFDHAFDWRGVDYGAEPVESFSAFAQTSDVFGDGSVRLLSTPGHTLGHQSVVARTRHGEVLLVGDAAYSCRELRGEARPLLIADEHLHRRSLQEIRRYLAQTPSAVAIPTHDAELWRDLPPLYE